MEEYTKHGRIGVASLRAGMHRNTGSKYVKAGKVPSDLDAARTWRTRPDPFEEHWPEIVARLTDWPELEAKALFEDLCERYPGRYGEGQVRTLQRRVKQWRAMQGPERVLFFEQRHRPGEAIQVDFTHASALGITIAGEGFPHQLFHSVLPYSNWEWATVARSESLLALKRGIQATVFRLGRVTEYLQTDNSSAATHDLGSGKREFNEEYLALVRHLGMKPRTTAIGEKEQNGDVEAMHNAFKRRLEQHLLLRGSRDFASVAAYEAWMQEMAEKANRARSKRLADELAVMAALEVHRLPEYRELTVRVTKGATIRVKNNTYTVPSRLKGESVRVRVYEDRLEVFYGGVRQLTVERLIGEGGHRINYRHVVWSMVRKPGAFERYRYREELFPRPVFRWAYEMLAEAHATTRAADLEYLRILLLAASTMESEVEAGLSLLLEAGEAPTWERLRKLVGTEETEIPRITIPEPDLASYDSLLVEVAR